MWQNVGASEAKLGERGLEIIYSDNSGSIAASGTGTTATIFNHAGFVHKISLAALAATPTAPGATTNGGQLEAIANLNAFTIQFIRPNSTNLNTKEALASSLVELTSTDLILRRPWRVDFGNQINTTITIKVSTSAFTVYVNYFVLVD